MGILKHIILELIALCQREDVLPTDSKELLQRLHDITDVSEDFLDEFIN